MRIALSAQRISAFIRVQKFSLTPGRGCENKYLIAIRQPGGRVGLVPVYQDHFFNLSWNLYFSPKQAYGRIRVQFQFEILFFHQRILGQITKELDVDYHRLSRRRINLTQAP